MVASIMSVTMTCFLCDDEFINMNRKRERKGLNFSCFYDNIYIYMNCGVQSSEGRGRIEYADQ